MNRTIALLTLAALMACGDSRQVPGPAIGEDAGRIIRPVLIDAGTGRCDDDFRETVAFCRVGGDASEPDKDQCVFAAIDAFEPCLGAEEACRERCRYTAIPPNATIEERDALVTACLASCSTDAG